MKYFISIILLLFCTSAGAATSHWTQTNETDFKTGNFHNVVATNLGDLKLSRAINKLTDEDPHIGAIYSMAEAKDGTIYAGTGPQGVLLQIKDGKVSKAAELGDGINISKVLIDSNGSILIGCSGEKGRVLRVNHAGEKPQVVFESKDVQYIWSMLQTGDGNLYIATGPNGQLFEVTPEGTRTVILKTDENNFISMIGDGKDLLYLGSDPNGLVYRVNRKTREAFVMYDAAESEISALVLDGDGNLFVGTSEAGEQTPAPDEPGTKEKAGRPEGGPGGVPIQAEPPAAPVPPPMPNPGPSDPIPKLDILPPLQNKDGGEDPGEKPPIEPPGGEPKNPEHSATSTKPTTPTVNTAGTGQPATAGNAIYKIDPNGFVSEVFRGQVLILSLIEHNGVLLVATGSEGLVYQINPGADEIVVVAKVDSKQVTTLLPLHDGSILLGLANIGGIASMGSGFAAEGTYTSQVFDASQTSRFGKVQMHGKLPAATALTIATRCGNVKEPSDTGWSKWSAEQPAAEFVQTQSNAARFFQYRFSFSTKADTSSPVINDVDVAYLIPNLPPQIKSIKVSLGGKNPTAPAAVDAEPSPGVSVSAVNSHMQTITWEASDSNSDALTYALYYHQASDGPWILLKDKLRETTYEWDTRTVADGRYQIKVTASDAAANPVGQGKAANRVSDSVLVDNTPPTIGDLKTTVKGTSATVSLRAVDRMGTISAVDYAVDSSQDWQAATPSDTMFDSPEAAASLTATHLSAGTHEIAIRVADNRGNQAFQSVIVTIAKQ